MAELLRALSWVKGIAFLGIILTTSFWGSIFYLAPFLSLLVVARLLRDSQPELALWVLRSYRRLTDRIIGLWLTLPPSLLKLLFNHKTAVFGDEVLKNERALIIMNHRTRLDWMFLWSPLMAFDTLRQLKVILKHELKFVPGAGWAMQVNDFIFLHRKWESDASRLRNMLDHLAQIGRPSQLLLFPEGTDFEPKTKARSDEFAKKHGLPIYEYVLHPRTTGFAFCVNRMIANQQIDALYDVTIAYPKSILQNEFGVLTGRVPEEIHFHIKRYPLQQLTGETDVTSEESISEWCVDRWREKEEHLKQFYLSVEKSHAKSEEASPWKEENGTCHDALIDGVYQWMILSVVLWTFSALFQFYLFLTSTFCFYYSLVVVAVYVVAGFFGGVETLETNLLRPS